MKEHKPEKWSSDLVLDLYLNLIKEIWEVVSALIGEAILEFLFVLSIRKVRDKYPFLASLRVSEEGVSWGGENGECRSIAPVEIHRGFQSLVTHLLNLFSMMTEGVIGGELLPKVLPKIKEAERIISQKM